MIRYLGSGVRNYALQPVLPYVRDLWEFQVILKGQCICTIPDYSLQQSTSRHLWLFGPKCNHGWTSHTNENISVLVFHFDSIPAGLSSQIQPDSWVQLDIHEEDENKLEFLFQGLNKTYSQVNPVNMVYADLVTAELSLLVAKKMGLYSIFSHEMAFHELVDRILAYYESSMASNIGVEEICREFNISTSTLRRIFHEVSNCSPQEAFIARKLHRAQVLLVSKTHSIKEISFACGFSEVSAFSRFFRQRTGKSPRSWFLSNQ